MGANSIVTGSPQPQVFDEESFRSAMSLWPSGVTIVTTTSDDGQRRGFTASSFSSVSLAPPLILVCLSRDAECHPWFLSTSRFAVNMLQDHHRPLALSFAKKSTDKFASGRFLTGPDGSPVLADALAVLHCTTYQLVEAGDHTILIGLVTDAAVTSEAAAHSSAMVHYIRRFRRLASEARTEEASGPDLPWFF